MNAPVVFGLGALGAWLIFRGHNAKAAPAEAAPGASLMTLSSPLRQAASSAPSTSKVPTLDESPSASTGNYLTHLSNAAAKVALINQGADTDEDVQAINQAWSDLGAPMDTLTVQKDLNVLGASPALVEDGIAGPKTREAIASFQSTMGLTSTGQMDTKTNSSLRRAVVAVTSQGAIS